MFGFWKKDRRGKRDEQKARTDLHYPTCVRAISTYIDAHPEPREDDLITIAVNAKLVYELFRHVDGARATGIHISLTPPSGSIVP